jgi:4-aminobutyrate aminotransferase
MPLGAFIARESIWTWPSGAHGSTFAGNPVCAAAGLATLDLMAGGLIDNAARMGALLRERLEALATRHAGVRDIRGIGLMIGIEFDGHDAANAVQQAAFERGLLVLECGEATLRLSPPLIVDEAAVEIALGIFDEALDAALTPRPGMQEVGG